MKTTMSMDTMKPGRPTVKMALILGLTLVMSVVSPSARAVCLRLFYPSIEQGLSNIVQPWHSIDYYRTKVADEWGFEAVKVWDRWYGPSNGEFSRLMMDPKVKVIVYRPLYMSDWPLNEHPRWENIDYGTVANEIYQYYKNVDKVVILTAWEQDNQFYRENDRMNAEEYLGMMNERQAGVAAARATYSGYPLRVYNAVEVSWVPDQVNYNSQDILHQFVPLMDSPPDMISYSAWGGTGPVSGLTANGTTKAEVYNIAQKLEVIRRVSGLSKNNIFVGEFGYRIDSGSHDKVTAFIDQARNWGTRLVFLWQFNMGVLVSEPFTVYKEPGSALSSGYSLESGTGIPYAKKTVEAVQSRRSLSKVCALYW